MLDKLQRVSAAPRDVMVVLRQAEEEARVLGAPSCEAEHILLALVDEPTVLASGALSSLGLSRERITEALERELTSALARAHIHVAELPRPRSLGEGHRVRWGESAQRLVERSIRESSDDPSLRVLLAVVHAEGGVIPRLLAELGVSVGDVEMAVARSQVMATPRPVRRQRRGSDLGMIPPSTRPVFRTDQALTRTRSLIRRFSRRESRPRRR